MDPRPGEMRLKARVPSHEDPAMAEVMAAPLGEQLARFAEWGLPRAGLLILMSACQGRCFFCASPAVTEAPPEGVTPRERIARWLADNRELGVEDLCIGGTEPTTHEAFAETLERAGEVGFVRIQLMTSGLALAEPGVARAWYRAGIRSVCVPLYAPEAALHDSVVGVAEHFERVTRGLDAARDEGIEPFVHTLALRRTLGEVARLGALSLARWNARLALAPLRAKDALFSYADESASYAELESALRDAPVSLVGFPSCVAPELPRDAALIMRLYFRVQKRELDPVCGGCARRAACPGIVAAHHAVHGASGLRPFDG